MKPPCSASWPTERWPRPRRPGIWTRRRRRWRRTPRYPGPGAAGRPDRDGARRAPAGRPGRARAGGQPGVHRRGHGLPVQLGLAAPVRATDAGRSAEQIAAYLAERATRGVPQPLDYLIRDRAPPRPDSGRHDDKLPALRRPGAARRGASVVYCNWRLSCDRLSYEQASAGACLVRGTAPDLAEVVQVDFRRAPAGGSVEGPA